MNKRIVITGVGMITPIGSGKDTFWNALIAGVSGVDDVTCIDTSGYKVHIEGEDKVAPDLFLMHPCNNIPANIAIEFGLKGPNTIIPTACAAGNYAIGYAYDLIKFGRVDMMLSGGSDPFSKVAYTGFARLGAIAPDICHEKGFKKRKPES